jgi:hypothetical protein
MILMHHTVVINPPDDSVTVAAHDSGSNETSGSVARSLVDGIRFATEVRELKELSFFICIDELLLLLFLLLSLSYLSST